MHSDRLYVCETCVRDALPSVGEPPLGRQLADAVEVELALRPELAERIIFRRVLCLNACLSPCSIALRGQDKVSLRFSRLTPQDAAAVVELAARYHAATDGDVPRPDWPASLTNKNTARTPTWRP